MAISPREQYLALVQSVIEEHGWAVQGSLPSADDPAAADVVPLFYTVGLTRKGLPELAMMGVPTSLAHLVLNMLARDMTPALAGGGLVELSLPTGPARVMLAPARGAAFVLDTAVALYGLTRLRPPLQVAFAF
jgi:hypothetical protein